MDGGNYPMPQPPAGALAAAANYKKIQPAAMVQPPMVPGQPVVQPPVIPPLTDQKKMEWNNFIDFVDKQGLRGSPMLDNRDHNMGQMLMQKYLQANPKASINYGDVPAVQQGLIDYRNQALQKIHAGGAQVPGMNSDADFMPGLSQIDGWLGSKTSTHRFPLATATKDSAGVKTAKNFGVDTKAYDAYMNSKK